MKGLLLFAHGARDPHWARPFEDVVRRIGLSDPELPVALSYLEFMSPDLATAGRGLVARGCTRIEVVPLFLGAGGHVRKDLPLLLEALRAMHPGVSWTLCQAVGEADGVIDALAKAALEPNPAS